MKELLILRTKRLVKIWLGSFIIILIVYDLLRSIFLFTYHQPAFDRSERTSSYKNLAQYLSSIDLKEYHVFVTKSVEGGQPLLLSYWLLQGNKEEVFNESIAFGDCSLDNWRNNKIICVLGEKKEKGKDFTLVKTIPNLTGDPIFWVIKGN